MSQYYFIRFVEKTAWFLKLYIIQYRNLLLFLAVFVLFYIFFMHWVNVRLLNQLRRTAAIACMVIELVAIAYFTILFRETGTSHTYELELFWSYKQWIFGGNIWLGMEILNNILLFFPLGFVLSDALNNSSFWPALLIPLFVSFTIEISQLLFKLGLFEFDDIFNNVLGAIAGWCVFHILRSFRSRKRNNDHMGR